VDFDLYKSWHVAWSFGHLKEKDSDTCAFSKAEAWQGSTVKSCVSHFRWYARARFSTALRIMCTCTLVRCTLFTNFHVYWCHLQVSALINYQRYLVIWIVAILDEYFLFLEQWRPSFAKVRDEGACTSFQYTFPCSWKVQVGFMNSSEKNYISLSEWYSWRSELGLPTPQARY